jgi:hypothetical protein
MPVPRAAIRSRAPFVALAALTIPCGLALRYTAVPLPRLVTTEGGDALYATLVYFLARVLWPAPLRRARAALAAVGFCFAIEIGQLCHAPWIDGVRKTVLGGLILGHGFLAVDLLAYVLGVGAGLLVERAARLRAASRSRTPARVRRRG